MKFSPRFYRGAAVCSLLSALTTLGLIFLPRFYSAPDFEARMALLHNPAYVLRSWIYLFHPFLVMTAVLAVWARCRARASGAATLGLIAFVLWGATEATQQALTKVAMDRTWRTAWPTADETQRQLIRNHVAMYDVLWDSLFLIILLAFLAGSIFLTLATRTTGGLGRWVSVAFAAGGAITVLNLLPELGVKVPAQTEWLYPLLQPAGRALIGVWLWREARNEPGGE